MQHKRPPVQVIVILLLVVLVGAYYGLKVLFDGNSGGLQASGTIEAVDVNISPEIAGKVSEVRVDEGEMVAAGDALLTLDDSLLSAQREVAFTQVVAARAALASVSHNYDIAVENALIAQQASTASDWRFSAPDEFNQPAWYFSQSEQIPAAQVELKAAQVALGNAQQSLQAVTTDIANADFLAAEKQLAEARAAFLVADEVKVQAEYAAESGGLLDAAYDAYNLSRDALSAAERAYNAFLNSDSAWKVQKARGEVAVAQQRYDVAYSRLVALQTGSESQQVVSAQKALDQAQAAAQQAEANLALLDVQLAKLSVYAPVAGTVVSRNVEPGEFVQPGATVLTLADLSSLTITVFVPEDRYGEISLGQPAQVNVDSFPGASFSAHVTYIADTAEYTPRNVQTVEGRSATVYAIKLKVSDPEGKLKPGMPADVVFAE
jgi:HlyD family secretion protein